jgi:tellurite resistance protein TehA-like permease
MSILSRFRTQAFPFVLCCVCLTLRFDVAWDLSFTACSNFKIAAGKIHKDIKTLQQSLSFEQMNPAWPVLTFHVDVTSLERAESTHTVA